MAERAAEVLGPKAAGPKVVGAKATGPKVGIMERLTLERDHLLEELVSEAQSESQKEAAGCLAFAASVGCTPAVLAEVDGLYAELEKEHAERVAALDRSFAELHAKRDAHLSGLLDRMDRATSVAAKLAKTKEALGRLDGAEFIDPSVKLGLGTKADAALGEAAEVRDLLLAWYCPKSHAPTGPTGPTGLTGLTGLTGPKVPKVPKLSPAKLGPSVRGRVDALVAAHLAAKAAGAPQASDDVDFYRGDLYADVSRNDVSRNDVI